MRSLIHALLLACSLGPCLAAQERPLAFVGARLIPITGPEIADGVVVVQNGRILAVGPRGETAIPDGAEQLDVSGKWIMPGMVCTHSHIAGPAGGDSSSPIQPDVRVLDAINVRDAGLQKAQAGGITTANIMPGSGHLLSGQTVYVKLKDGNSVDDLVLRNGDGTVAGGMKMANGTNSIRGRAPFPGTRGKSAALVRAQFIKAREYAAKIEAAAGDADEMPPRDLRLEALAEVLSGKRIVHHHTHRHDDIMTVLRLSKEFGFRVVLHHVSEAWKVADEIAAAGAPCSLIMLDSPGGKLEAMDIDWRNAPVLEQAGALVGFHTDDGITDSRFFRRSGALAVRAGMSRAGALKGLTLAGAEMLDLQDRVGSLDVGKDADLVVFSGDPLSVYSMVEQTWVEGELVFDHLDEEDRNYALGGYGASVPQVFHFCCYGNNFGNW